LGQIFTQWDGPSPVFPAKPSADFFEFIFLPSPPVSSARAPLKNIIKFYSLRNLWRQPPEYRKNITLEKETFLKGFLWILF